MFHFQLFLLSLFFTSLSKTTYPNFVVILLDDVGWGDPSYNNGTAYTPNLDAWTKQPNTITFHRGYSGAPVCSPTRASILSGRTPNRECIYTANGCGSRRAWTCSAPMPFSNSTFTIAKAVKKANENYSTAFFGKWHLGDFWDKEEANGMSVPSSHGFDYWIATEASAPSVTPNCACFTPVENCVVGHYTDGPWCTNYWYANESSPIGVANITYKIPGEDSIYLVDQFEDWLKRTDLSQPFLALIFMHPTHSRFLATDEWREACANGTYCPKNRTYTSAQLDYFGDLSSTDVQIGRIRNLLLEYNVINNTLIWFTSDNGPAGVETGAYGDDNHPGSTNGLRGRKTDVWEGGIREPTIIEFNGYISNKNGYNSSYPIVTYDILPTIMDLLNVTSDNPNWSIDGISLVPLFDDYTMTHRYSPIGWSFKGSYAWINDTWKLVINSSRCEESDPQLCYPALYNLENDPYENYNIASENIDRYNAMMNDLTNWLISVNISQFKDSKCAIRNPASIEFRNKANNEQRFFKLFLDSLNSTFIPTTNPTQYPTENKNNSKISNKFATLIGAIIIAIGVCFILGIITYYYIKRKYEIHYTKKDDIEIIPLHNKASVSQNDIIKVENESMSENESNE